MLKKGDTCYIVENNARVTPAIILSVRGNLYTIRLATGTTLRLPGHRLFETEEQAKASMPDRETVRRRQRTPYDYM